ncbi:hypothetical protein WICMUC_005870 [Wickerhamomyces mucosus]|uniref:Uncharacterized protein n=1 Tax=Wickerhamomyces mucosus TaxID=1378264 RepID=A0A9P8T2R1_9ASCO|nr:hypothetical protein WICMUC_005870 [Wickerhamomyces mucosus]
MIFNAYKIAALISLLNLSPITLINGPVMMVTNGFNAVAGVLETISAIAKAEVSLKSLEPYIKPCKKIGKTEFGPFDRTILLKVSFNSSTVSLLLFPISSSTKVLITVDKRLYKALPATSAIDPNARALKASIGDCNKVGINIGKITSDLVVIISCSADNAFSESEDCNRFNKNGMISSTATLPTTSWNESKALADASRTDEEESIRVLRMISTKIS